MRACDEMTKERSVFPAPLLNWCHFLSAMSSVTESPLLLEPRRILWAEGSAPSLRLILVGAFLRPCAAWTFRAPACASAAAPEGTTLKPVSICLKIRSTGQGRDLPPSSSTLR